MKEGSILSEDFKNMASTFANGLSQEFRNLGLKIDWLNFIFFF